MWSESSSRLLATTFSRMPAVSMPNVYIKLAGSEKNRKSGFLVDVVVICTSDVRIGWLDTLKGWNSDARCCKNKYTSNSRVTVTSGGGAGRLHHCYYSLLGGISLAFC